jgi:hypothetical protein
MIPHRSLQIRRLKKPAKEKTSKRFFTIPEGGLGEHFNWRVVGSPQHRFVVKFNDKLLDRAAKVLILCNVEEPGEAFRIYRDDLLSEISPLEVTKGFGLVVAAG